MILAFIPSGSMAAEDHDWTNPHYQAKIRSDRILSEARIFYHDIHEREYNRARKYLRKIISNLRQIKEIYQYGF